MGSKNRAALRGSALRSSFRERQILNYFRAQKLISSGVVEGLDNKAKVIMRKSYGFRTYRVLELALYHSLGKLPEPELTHVFF
jgi:transposase